ncbi:MAG: Rpn family recombination-promoting nuclease/putative transposase [Treponema sp.]|jgi:predicted transposase/invertase (TIGR01784 family)|nr:Rpn family recombination-promoting nuclease/putative transposase [Treponema sp.]
MGLIRFGESDELIDICRDNVFKAVFTRNTPESRKALCRLLSAIIGRELTVIAITANEPPIDNLRDRQIRFDITCKGKNEELANVEMSLNPDAYEPVRLEFHAGKLFTGQEIRGREKTYDDLKEAYQIAILARGRFFADDEFLHGFEYYDPERKIALGGRSRIITLELSKLDKVVEKPVGSMTMAERWGIFFRYITDKSKREKINELVEEEEGIAMAGEVLQRISKDEVERAWLASEYKYAVDTQSKVVQARREGRQEGRQEEHMRAYQEKLEGARKLKQMGVPADTIAMSLGLLPDEVAKL